MPDLLSPPVSATQAHTPTALEIATSALVVKLALRTSMIVGSVLNIINQGDALLGAARLDLVKLALTYCIPYCVCTYSATTIALRRR